MIASDEYVCSVCCIQWKMNRTFVNLHINQKCENLPNRFQWKRNMPQTNSDGCENCCFHFIVLIGPIISRSVVFAAVTTTAQHHQQQPQPCQFGVNLFKSSVTLFIVVWPGHMPTSWYNKKSRTSMQFFGPFMTFDHQTTVATVSTVW